MNQWQTIRQYANSKGVSAQYIYKLKKEQSQKGQAYHGLEFAQEPTSKMWKVREI